MIGLTVLGLKRKCALMNSAWKTMMMKMMMMMMMIYSLLFQDIGIYQSHCAIEKLVCVEPMPCCTILMFLAKQATMKKQVDV